MIGFCKLFCKVFLLGSLTAVSGYGISYSMINTQPPSITVDTNHITIDDAVYVAEQVHHYVRDGDYISIWFVDHNRTRVPLTTYALEFLSGCTDLTTDPQEPQVEAVVPPTAVLVELTADPVSQAAGTRLVSYTYDFTTAQVNLRYETVVHGVTSVTRIEPAGVHVSWAESMPATPELLLSLHEKQLEK